MVARSCMQQCVTSSVTEAEMVAVEEIAQDMMFIKHIFESLGFKVKEPMILGIDNKGVVDMVNNWSMGGHTQQMPIRIQFLWVTNLKRD